MAAPFGAAFFCTRAPARKNLAVFFPCRVRRPAVSYVMRFVLLGPCMFAVLGSLGAVAAQDPYQHIPSRNVFDLKEPAPAPAPTSEVAPSSGKLILTGIVTMLGNKRAILKRTAVGKPSEASKDESFILAEGQNE